MTDSNSSINNLIGTFATIDINTNQNIPDNLVCIDTSNNRIGINTIDPEYSLDISNGSLRVQGSLSNELKIIFTNLPTIQPVISGQLWRDPSGFLRIV